MLYWEDVTSLSTKVYMVEKKHKEEFCTCGLQVNSQKVSQAVSSYWLSEPHPMPFEVHKRLPVMQKMTHSQVNQKRNQCALISVPGVALQHSSVPHLAKGCRFQFQVILSCCYQAHVYEFPEQSDNHKGRTTFET